ncbi:hypothetical protein [Paraburkholderia nodosa]|uniref:hypothetical protein n=1 Tax=Paraburkholderia nodosa TaxID=392320 RepID=UPI0012B69213|nr:hypothetical protein [Paraburkholderia nodosa]
MADAYGEDYGSDDNIFHERATYGSVDMILTADRTSGENAPRTIFERRKDGKWCVVLASPPVSTITPKIGKDITSRPREWTTITQSAPDFNEIKVVYLWNKHRAIYMPAYCYYIGRRKLKKFDCSSAYK